MAFLGGLALLGSAYQQEQKNMALGFAAQQRQEALRLRELQMQNALQKMSLAMGQRARAKSDKDAVQGVEGSMFGLTGGGDPSPPPANTSGDRSEGVNDSPEDVGLVPVADEQQLSALPGGAPGTPPSGGMLPGQPAPGAGAPPGQPAPGQAQPQQGAPQPPQGQPAAQLGQMPQGQPQMQPGMQPPGPQGQPTFAQQQQQPQQPQRQQMKPGTPQQGPFYAQAPQQQPQQQRGGPQPLPKSPEELRSQIRAYRDPKTGKPLSPEMAGKVYKDMLPRVMQEQQFEASQQQRGWQHEQAESLRAERQRKEEEAKAPTLTGGALDAAAEHYYRTGNYGGALGGLGSGKHRDANVAAITQRAIELHPEDPVKNWPAEQQAFNTKVAGLRVIQQRGANLRLASNEAKRLLPRLEPFLDHVSPTRYPDINKMIQSFEEKTGDETIVRYGQALSSLRYVYARVLKPIGVITVSDLQEAGDKLNKAWSAGQLRATIDQMKVEIKSAEQGLRDTEAEYGLKYGAPTDDEQKAAQQPEEEKQQQGLKPPTKDDIIDGYRFKGGDPKDKNNWEPVS